jgi:hypothetical protein
MTKRSSKSDMIRRVRYVFGELPARYEMKAYAKKYGFIMVSGPTLVTEGQWEGMYKYEFDEPRQR